MKLRVEIGQYEFVEADVVTPEEAKQLHTAIKREFHTGDGIPKKEWDKIVEDLLNGKGLVGDPGIIQQMSKYQQAWVDEYKRGIKRIKNKENE